MLAFRQPVAHALLVLGTLGALSLPTNATAHVDDPKVFDRVPPYDGPGYRRPEVVTMGDPPLDHPFPYQNMTLWSWITLPEVRTGLTSGNDCWGYVSPSGREYALFGTSHGTAVIEVTNPSRPVQTGFVVGPTSLWRDIETYGTHAYIVSEGGDGIQVVDLSGVDSGVVTLVRNVTTGGTAATHTMAINTQSGYLYRNGGGGLGLRIYSLREDPTTPQLVATWPDRYVHDAIITTYTSGRWAGREVAFCCSGFNNGWTQTGVDVLDVTDKANIRPLARLVYGQGAYSHQAWLSADKNWLYLDDELDEQGQGVTTRTRVIDVSDLRAPAVASTFTSGSTAIDHNLTVHNGLIFEANYRSGLRVFDASDPAAPVQIAWLDTWPDDDNANFNGLWSAYPFFPSGTIIGSDLERGLFVMTLGDPTGNATEPPGLPGPLVRDRMAANRTMGLAAAVPGAGVEVPVVLNEVGWTSGPGLEWVELLNVSRRDVNLEAWSLQSADGRVVVPLSGRVRAGETFVVAQRGAASCVTPSVTYDAALLADGGLRLVGPGSALIESISSWHAGDSDIRASMERRDSASAADTPAAWRTGSRTTCGLGLGTPGAANQGVRVMLPPSDPGHPLRLEPARRR